MKDDARDRDSLGEFQSSIFDASDGHQLVDFIRKKKGLRTQPLKIFDDVHTQRQSLQIEIQRLDDHEKTLQPKERRLSNAVEDVVPPINPQSGRLDEPRSPHKSPSRTSATFSSKVKLKRLSHTIGRRTLLKEFEKTIQESAFLPPTFSTPLTSDLPNSPAINVGNNTQNGLALSKRSNIISDKQSNFRLVCSPITLTDNDSPSQEIVNAAHPGITQTPTESDDTEKCMRHLQQQNDFLLELAKSNETLHLRETSPEPEYIEQNKENPKSPIQSPINQNRTLTPSKNQRRTYTIQRDNTSGKFILSPDKSIENSVRRQPLSPKTPIKNTIGFGKLTGTPEQRKLLLSRFGRNSTNNAHTSQKSATDQNTFSKFKSVASEKSHVSGFSGESHYKEAASVTIQSPKHQNTAQIIEQIQKSGPSNVPVIVIPVNQTFNQASNRTSPRKASTYMNSPNSNEITSTTTITAPQPKPPDSLPIRKSNLPLNSLRLEDIITDDESSCTDESARTRLYTRKSSTASIQNANKLQVKDQFRIRLPPPRNSSRHIRELVSPQRLTEMSIDEVLDLRKRNSNGDLRKHLSKREKNFFDKQIELELLRRSIQEPNYEDEVFQMEVLPAPPKEFSDKRKSLRLEKSLQMDVAAKKNDFVDECSSDRVSLVTDPKEKLSQSTAGRKPRGKKKEMSEQLTNYLQASQRVSRSKYLNLSKRKLYNKGNSDETSSDDNSPDMTAQTSRRTLKSPRKSNQHISIINKTSTKTPPRPINSSVIHKSPLVLFPTTPINPPAEFADQSKAQRENEIFKKPIGIPPRKRRSPRKQKHLTKNRSAVSLPVDSDCASSTTSNLSESSAVRRSTRAKKAPTAYWSCSNKELRPMYDIYRAYTTSIESKRANKYESSKNKKLVANTKTKQSNSVANRQTNSQTKRKTGKSNEQAESTNTSSLCPSYHGTSSSSDYQLNFPEAVSEDQRHSSSDASTTVEKASKTKKPTKKIPLNTDKNESHEIPNAAQNAIGNKEKQIKSKLRGPRSRRDPSTDPESISSLEEPHPAALTTIMENSHSETSQTSGISDLSETSNSKSKISISKSRKLITNQAEFSLSDDQQLHDTTKTSKTSKETERRQSSSDEDESASINDVQPQVGAKAPKSKTGNSISSNFSSDAHEWSTAESSQSQSTAKISKSREAKQKKKQRIRKLSSDEDMSSSDVPQSKSTAKASNLKGSKSKSRYLSAESDSASAENAKKKSTDNKKKSASSKSKKLQPSTNCASPDNSSSIQQIRHLTTIAEDSLPEFEQQVTISVSELEKEPNTDHRLGTKSINSNRVNRIKDAFRTEHDRSIADASSAHVNKLFEQLKSSSMCINGEVTVRGVNCSGQVSQDKRLLNDQSSAQHKCKNLTVRVLRSRYVIKSPEGNDKVCDSGFSSEDVSSEQNQRGDILLNWLKQIISKSPIDSQKGVARFLQSDGFHAARVDDLVFQEVDGVDYAFYNTKQRFSFGYMRFNPKTEKKRCKAKKYELNFLVLCGSISITVNGNTFDCKNGDLITVFIGTLYGISNNSNDPALVMVIKK